MTVHPLEIESHDGAVRVRAAIEWEQSVPYPTELWFMVPNANAEDLSHTADAFLVSLILPAMWAGEDVVVRGRVSPKLLRNLDAYQRVFNTWRPHMFTYVNVTADDTREGAARGMGVMCSFSGGVDSFHCLHEHLPERESDPRRQITHALFVHGFDIPLSDEATFTTAAASYSQLMEQLGISFVPVRTNLRQFHDRPDWDATYVSAVIGTGLLFGASIARFYLPEINTFSYDPRDEHRERHGNFFENQSVPLLSTDRTAVENRGGAVSKIEKIRTIAHWDAAYERLRVCWEHPYGLRNCGSCSKCLLTMSALSMEGSLERFTTFPAAIDRRAVRKSRFAIDRFYFPETWIEYAHEKGRSDIVFDYRYALAMSRLRRLWERFIARTKRLV